MTAVAGYMGLTNIFTGVVRNADILIVGNYVSLAELAVYVAASRMAELMNLVYMLLDPIAVPQLSRMDYAGNLQETKRIASNYALTSASIGTMLWLLFAIFGNSLLSLYGPGFSGGTTTMLLMATAYLTNSITGPASQILTITGFHRLNFYITVFATLFYLLALGILTSQYGITGAALSTILYQTVRNFLQALFVWRLKRINTMVFGSRIGRGANL
jgi:O-antigen/teichoic acid export membrane protein